MWDALGAILLVGLIWLTLRQRWRTEIRVQGRGVHWHLWVRTQFVWLAFERNWPAARRPPAAQPASGSPRRRLNLQKIASGLMAMGLYHRLVARVWRRVEIEAFHLDLHLGLGDASRTAQATGWVCGALAGWLTERILPQARSVPEWRVTPDWDGVGVAGRAEGVFQIRASAVLATFLAAVWEGAALAVRRRSKWR